MKVTKVTCLANNAGLPDVLQSQHAGLDEICNLSEDGYWI